MLSIRSQDYVVAVLVSIFISKTHKHFGSATCALRMTHNMYICIYEPMLPALYHSTLVPGQKTVLNR